MRFKILQYSTHVSHQHWKFHCPGRIRCSSWWSSYGLNLSRSEVLSEKLYFKKLAATQKQTWHLADSNMPYLCPCNKHHCMLEIWPAGLISLTFSRTTSTLCVSGCLVHFWSCDSVTEKNSSWRTFPAYLWGWVKCCRLAFERLWTSMALS